MQGSHHHQRLREPEHPTEDPWRIVSRVVADLGHSGIKSRFGSEARFGEAAQHAAALLDALDVQPVIPDEEDSS
jgi:hypothetical protein